MGFTLFIAMVLSFMCGQYSRHYGWRSEEDRRLAWLTGIAAISLTLLVIYGAVR